MKEIKMSTSALIAYKNKENLYNVNSVHFDGYIDGVGKNLKRFWDFEDDVQELCNGPEIRSIGDNYDDVETFTTRTIKRRKNLTFFDLCNLAGNYDFTYVFENDHWQRLNNNDSISEYTFSND